MVYCFQEGGVFVNNLLSIFLGLAAWGLPILYLFRRRKQSLCCGLSLSAWGLSLYFQIRELTRLVQKPDWSAVDDTITAVCLCATVLTVSTLLLNAIALTRKES